ncbi:MAG TPA: hypothetical protein VI585_18720 [Candidatus Binatia bacterium]
MKRALGIAYVHSALTFALIASGCQSTALRPLPDVEPRPGMEPGGIERQAVKEEIIGTVERVNRTNNEIRLRTTEAKVIVIKYDPATRVYSREREVGIDALRPRDLILIRASKTSRGEQYADLIRLNDRDESASKPD